MKFMIIALMLFAAHAQAEILLPTPSVDNGLVHFSLSKAGVDQVIQISGKEAQVLYSTLKAGEFEKGNYIYKYVSLSKDFAILCQKFSKDPAVLPEQGKSFYCQIGAINP